MEVRGQFDDCSRGDPTQFAAENLSAVHCLSSEFCFTAWDEVRFIQSFRGRGDQVDAGKKLYLWNTPDGRDADELDVEGITSIDGHLVVVGSHSVSRQKCEL